MNTVVVSKKIMNVERARVVSLLPTTLSEYRIDKQILNQHYDLAEESLWGATRLKYICLPINIDFTTCRKSKLRRNANIGVEHTRDELGGFMSCGF